MTMTTLRGWSNNGYMSSMGFIRSFRLFQWPGAVGRLVSKMFAKLQN
jgi:hypothetical protein